ncbi:MAG: hypothetical protein ISS70_16200 [Phycisphaerae bacterium]|nr:hypothetical protein [Phycisphaerae bacterium]
MRRLCKKNSPQGSESVWGGFCRWKYPEKMPNEAGPDRTPAKPVRIVAERGYQRAAPARQCEKRAR